MQTTRGFDRLAVVKQHADEPRSYIVATGDGEYRRNRRHLLPVNEPPTLPPPEPSVEVTASSSLTIEPDAGSTSTSQMNDNCNTVQTPQITVSSPATVRRNPPRDRRMPERYKDYQC